MCFDCSDQFRFSWCGKFIAPNDKWIHETRKMDSCIIFYVTDGVLYIADNNGKYTVNAGEFLITPPTGYQYGWKSSGCSYYWFHFECEKAQNSFPLSGKFSDIDTIKNYYSILYRNNGIHDIGGLLIHALIRELCSVKSAENHSSGLCYSIMEHIKFSSAADLRVSLIAERFGYSPRYLSHIFYAETGCHLKQYITDEIMSRSKHLLENTGLSIKDIGTGLGFSDSHNFSHAFKNHFGISPLLYRQKNKQQRTDT